MAEITIQIRIRRKTWARIAQPALFTALRALNHVGLMRQSGIDVVASWWARHAYEYSPDVFKL